MPPKVQPTHFFQSWISELGALVQSILLQIYQFFHQKISVVGEVMILLFKIFWRIPRVVQNPNLTVEQIINIAVASFPLIFTAAFFTGAIAAESAKFQFRNFIPDRYIGTGVCLSVILELGPVLTGLVLAGRTSSAIAAEIGSMKEKEELDAMVVLNLDPLRYLAMPRILTCIAMFPILTIIADFLAIIGGWLDSVLLLGLTTSTYVFGLRFLFDPYYIVVGLTKSLVFGLIVALMGYYNGIRSGAGARGVGNATMTAVVSSSVGILIADFFISYIMLSSSLVK